MEHLPTALLAMKTGAQNWDQIKDPAERQWLKARGKLPKDDPDLVDARTMEERGYILRKRHDVRSDEEIVEVVRHKGQVLPRRPRTFRKTSSMENTRENGGRPRYRRDPGGYASDSEGSVPPRGRKARSTGGRSRRGQSSTSSSSSSELGSTTDEEHEMKKVNRKKWITGSLAAVATIHAASKVYGSVEKHDKRIIAVENGTLSPEQAHQEARRARWQDAAAIGIAFLGIKGAVSEWKGLTEEHEHYKELCAQHDLQHKRRVEHLRRQRARKTTGYYKGRDGNWYYDGEEFQNSDKRSNRSGSAATWDTYDQLQGPRQGERKMLESSQDRSRSAYDRNRSSNHDRDDRYDRDSRYDRELSRKRSPSRSKRDKLKDLAQNPVAISLAAAPFLAAGAYQLTKRELADEPIFKVNPDHLEEYQKSYKADQHSEYKDFGLDFVEEILDKVT